MTWAAATAAPRVPSKAASGWFSVVRRVLSRWVSRDRITRSIFLPRSPSRPLSSISLSSSENRVDTVLYSPPNCRPLPSSHRGGHVTPALLPPTPAVAVTVAAAAAAHGLLPGSRAALPASLRLSVCPSSPWWCCREDSRSRHQTRCSVECPLSLSLVRECCRGAGLFLHRVAGGKPRRKRRRVGECESSSLVLAAKCTRTYLPGVVAADKGVGE